MVVNEEWTYPNEARVVALLASTSGQTPSVQATFWPGVLKLLQYVAPAYWAKSLNEVSCAAVTASALVWITGATGDARATAARAERQETSDVFILIVE